MSNTPARSRLVTILSAVVALAFVGAAIPKLMGAEHMVSTFERFGLSLNFLRFIGVAELAGAVGLFLPRLAPLAAGGLAVVVAGAVAENLMHYPVAQAVAPAVLLVLCVFLAYSRGHEMETR